MRNPKKRRGRKPGTDTQRAIARFTEREDAYKARLKALRGVPGVTPRLNSRA